MTNAPVLSRLRPLAIVHRAGNELPLLRQAESLGLDLVEADIWPYRGRLEVRHLKTLGPLPIPLLWDREGWTRWRLAAGWRPRPLLADLLQSIGPGTELMLDLKGADHRMPSAIKALLTKHMPGRPITVCSQNWSLISPFAGTPGIAVVHSAGNPRQLQRLLALRPAAASIHRRLLTPDTVLEIKRSTSFLMTWPIRSATDMREILAWGVDGIISSDMHLLRELVDLRQEA